MSEQTVPETTVVEFVVVPWYKNKRIVLTAAAVTTAVVVMAYLKFRTETEDETVVETIEITPASSPKK